MQALTRILANNENFPSEEILDRKGVLMKRKVSFLLYPTYLFHSWNTLVRRRFNMRRSNVIRLFVVIIATFGVLTTGVAQNRDLSLPYRFLIPEGYVGWVRVDFDVATAPPLPLEEGYRILKFTE